MGVSVFLSRESARWWSAVASCASRDSSRVVLTGVYVETGQLWSPILGYYDGVSLTATDSYRLLSVAIPADQLSVAGFVDDFAVSRTGSAFSVSDGFRGRVLVPARAFKVARSSGLRLDWAATDVTEEAGASYGMGVQVRATVGNANGDVVSVFDAIAGDFPNWQNLIPSGDIGRLDPFAVNGAYLGGMLSDMAKASGVDSAQRVISAVDGRKPVRVDCVGDGFAACGIVMPVRIPTDDGDVLGHLPTADGGETAAVAS